jgi:hypothetical protein
VALRRRQVDVATAARLSRSLVASIDRGDVDGVTIGAITGAASSLGADVDLVLRWRGERLDRLLDEDHARLVDIVVRRLRAATWNVEVEVSFSIWGERGSIDVLAQHPATGSLLVVEVKSVVPDSQELLHRLDQKARLAPKMAGELSRQVRTVSGVLVIGATATSRRRIARLATTYDPALRDRGTAVREWLRQPAGHCAGSWSSHTTAKEAVAAKSAVGNGFGGLGNAQTTALRGFETAAAGAGGWSRRGCRMSAARPLGGRDRGTARQPRVDCSPPKPCATLRLRLAPSASRVRAPVEHHSVARRGQP